MSDFSSGFRPSWKRTISQLEVKDRKFLLSKMTPAEVLFRFRSPLRASCDVLLEIEDIEYGTPQEDLILDLVFFPDHLGSQLNSLLDACAGNADDAIRIGEHKIVRSNQHPANPDRNMNPAVGFLRCPTRADISVKDRIFEGPDFLWIADRTINDRSLQ